LLVLGWNGCHQGNRLRQHTGITAREATGRNAGFFVDVFWEKFNFFLEKADFG
jgi:hypothetical protein